MTRTAWSEERKAKVKATWDKKLGRVGSPVEPPGVPAWFLAGVDQVLLRSLVAVMENCKALNVSFRALLKKAEAEVGSSAP